MGRKSFWKHYKNVSVNLIYPDIFYIILYAYNSYKRVYGHKIKLLLWFTSTWKKTDSECPAATMKTHILTWALKKHFERNVCLLLKKRQHPEFINGKRSQRTLCDFKNWSFRYHILRCITRFESDTLKAHVIPTIYQFISWSLISCNWLKAKQKSFFNTFKSN